jgi:hypothetical protein
LGCHSKKKGLGPCKKNKKKKEKKIKKGKEEERRGLNL